MILKNAATIISLLLSCSLAHAASEVFSDNFDSYIPDQFNWAPPVSSGWTVTSGNVDLNGVGGSYDFFPGNGSYVDLDGSSFVSGVLSRDVDLIGGMTYLLSFDLAGSQRGTLAETVHVNFGSAAATYTLDSTSLFSTHALSFTPVANGTYSLSYLDVSGDNRGLFLDNVSVAAVPEPKTYAMLLAGLGLLGFAARRKKQQDAA
jgi:hypothetical protein